RGHVALRDRAGQLQQADSECGFAMIYMGDNTEVTDVVCHCVREYNLFLPPPSSPALHRTQCGASVGHLPQIRLEFVVFGEAGGVTSLPAVLFSLPGILPPSQCPSCVTH